LLWITKSESYNSDCNGNIFNFLKCSLQESLFLIPMMSLIVFFFLQSKNIPTIIWVSTKYYSIHHNWVEVGIIYHLQWFLGHKRSNCSNCNTCWTQFWNKRINMGLPSESVVLCYSKKFCIKNISYFLLFFFRE